MDQLVCVDDFEREALRKLPKGPREYYASGADDERTVKENVESYSKVLIRPRMLRDVSNRDLSTTILGKKVRVPLGVAPSAMQRLAHPDGECGSAQAVDKIGGIMVLSVFATSSYEELAAVAPNCRKWFQFYLHKDRNITRGLIERASKAGFEAMVLTVDAQYVGKRRAMSRNSITFPKHLTLPNVVNNAEEILDLYAMHDNLESAVTWEAVTWLKSASKLPLVLKGIQTADDARRGVECGADAIWVSNHGGRQIDTVPTTIEILPSIVKAVGGRAEIFMDSGIRRGADIFKALALGAKMVFVGRPPIFGLAVGGAQGATKVLEILRDELDLTMALTGVSKIREITPDYVTRKDELSKL